MNADLKQIRVLTLKTIKLFEDFLLLMQEM